MLGDTFLNTIASMGGLGFSDLKWKKPVMVGDTIGGTATIAGAAPLAPAIPSAASSRSTSTSATRRASR